MEKTINQRRAYFQGRGNGMCLEGFVSRKVCDGNCVEVWGSRMSPLQRAATSVWQPVMRLEARRLDFVLHKDLQKTACQRETGPTSQWCWSHQQERALYTMNKATVQCLELAHGKISATKSERKAWVTSEPSSYHSKPHRMILQGIRLIPQTRHFYNIGNRTGKSEESQLSLLILRLKKYMRNQFHVTVVIIT